MACAGHSNINEKRALWRAFACPMPGGVGPHPGCADGPRVSQYIFLGSIWLRKRLKCRLMAADFLRLRSVVGFS